MKEQTSSGIRKEKLNQWVHILDSLLPFPPKKKANSKRSSGLAWEILAPRILCWESTAKLAEVEHCRILGQHSHFINEWTKAREQDLSHGLQSSATMNFCPNYSCSMGLWKAHGNDCWRERPQLLRSWDSWDAFLFPVPLMQTLARGTFTVTSSCCFCMLKKKKIYGISSSCLTPQMKIPRLQICLGLKFPFALCL